MSLLSELKRRNVLRVGAAYIVVAWLIIQVAETLFPLFGFGDGPARVVVIVLAIGFVPALIVSWAFELTPEGLKRDSEVDPEHSIAPHTGKKLDRMIMIVLVLALAYFAFDKFVLDPQRDAGIAESATEAGAQQAREEARLGMFNEKSVAVLPFTNHSKKEEDEYFSDGMHDELLTRLSRIAALKVISRTSVMRYRDTLKSIPEIARELSVATILEGGVQRSGDQVRINVQLIDAHTDEHLWADIFDRKLTAENLFAIQSEISTAIADALKAALSPEEESRVYDLPTFSLEAYNHYLRGRQLMASRNSADMELARVEFEQATDIDPDFALAWVGLGDAGHRLLEAGVAERFEHREEHKQAVEKALAINDQLGEAYASLSHYYGELEEHEKAVPAMRKAIELNPNYAQAYHWYALMQSGPDRGERAIQLLYKAAELDPLSSIVQLNIGVALYRLGREKEGRQKLLQLSQMDPDFAVGYWVLADFDAENGQFADAVQGYRSALQLDPGNGRLLLAAARAFIALGDFEAVADLRKDMDRHLGTGNAPGFELDWSVFVAQSKWQDAIKMLDALDQQTREHYRVMFAYFRTYSYSGDFKNAHKFLMKMEPEIGNRDRWQQDYTDQQTISCSSAGVLIEAGDEALGQDFLRLFVRNIEASRSGQDPTIGRPWGWITCHLVAGTFDDALDILDRETGQGHLVDQWWQMGKIYWWKQLEDNPRYIALVNRIETKLAEQRALLSEMDESGQPDP